MVHVNTVMRTCIHVMGTCNGTCAGLHVLMYVYILLREADLLTVGCIVLVWRRPSVNGWIGEGGREGGREKGREGERDGGREGVMEGGKEGRRVGRRKQKKQRKAEREGE